MKGQKPAPGRPGLDRERHECACWTTPLASGIVTAILAGVAPQAMHPYSGGNTPHAAQSNDQAERVMRTALLLTDGGDLRGAIATLNTARNDGHITAGAALYGKALACERAGHLERALRYMEKSDYEDGHYGSPFALRAELMYRTGRYDDLERWCNTWELAGEYEVHYRFLSRARLMHARGGAAGARRHVEAILVVEPTFPGALELYGDMLAGEDSRRALRQYGKALKADPTAVHAHAKRARMLAKMGRVDLAVRACRRALRALPPNKILKDTCKAIRDGA